MTHSRPFQPLTFCDSVIARRVAEEGDNVQMLKEFNSSDSKTANIQTHSIL